MLGLGEQLDELARYLRRFAIDRDRVTVELEHDGRLLGLSRPVPAGGDALMVAAALLEVAAASLALIGAGA